MQFETYVKQIIQRTSEVKSFRFERPKGFEFIAGQFMFITLRREGKSLTKHFTISSSPTETDFLEMTKKLTGHEFSNALAALKEGDGIFIDAPYGEFTFKGEYDKIALLSGGIGITPLRSIIKYSTDKKLKTNIILLYSNRSEDEIVFKEELENMQNQNMRLKVVNTVTRPGEKWTGAKGRINKELIEKEIPDHMGRIFYISGPQRMVDDLAAILGKEMNIPEKQIKQEYFPGY